MQGVLGLFGVSLAAVMAELCLPHGKDGGTRKYLRYLSSLAILLLILSPIADFLRGGATLEAFSFPQQTEEDFAMIYSSAFKAAEREAASAAIAEQCGAAFATPAACFRVSIQCEGETPVKILVRLSGKGLLCDPDRVADFIGRSYGIAAEVR